MKSLAILLILIPFFAGAQTGTPASANNQFAFSYFSQLDKFPGKNFCVSPYSISSAFAMTYAGAAGETQKEFQKVFGFGENDTSFHNSFGQLNASLLKNNSKDNTFSIANRLFQQKGSNLDKNFLGITGKAYNATPEAVDYKLSETTRQHINSWVQGQTHDRIKDLLPPGALSSDTRLVLVNALYLKCKWAHAFDKSNTTTQPFYGDKGAKSDCSLMYQRISARYISDKQFRAIELPYKDSTLSMVVILPSDDQVTLESVRKDFSAARYNELLNGMRYHEVYLYLPKFKTEFFTSLKKDLSKMGMTSSFSNAADFSKMSQEEDFYISDAYHKTFVEVDESGTEAAAATAVVMNLKSEKAIVAPVTFRADHPFIYLIRDRSTGAILFMGELHSPNAG